MSTEWLCKVTIWFWNMQWMNQCDFVRQTKRSLTNEHRWASSSSYHCRSLIAPSVDYVLWFIPNLLPYKYRRLSGRSELFSWERSIIILHGIRQFDSFDFCTLMTTSWLLISLSSDFVSFTPIAVTALGMFLLLMNSEWTPSLMYELEHSLSQILCPHTCIYDSSSSNC